MKIDHTKLWAAAGLAVVCCASVGAKTVKTPVPEDVGLYLGSGVYGNSDGLHCGGFCSTYPSAANMDVGPGSEYDHVGLVGYLYRYVAKISRGNVFITGPDFENPDEDCRWIVYSYFPDAGKICLLNLDYEHERKCVLQQFGDKEFLSLKPGEFRIIDTVVLDPEEKLNDE